MLTRVRRVPLCNLKMPRTMEDDPPNPERLPRDANSYHICHYTVGMLALVHTHPQYLTDGDLRGDYQASVQEIDIPGRRIQVRYDNWMRGSNWRFHWVSIRKVEYAFQPDDWPADPWLLDYNNLDVDL